MFKYTWSELSITHKVIRMVIVILMISVIALASAALLGFTSSSKSNLNIALWCIVCIVWTYKAIESTVYNRQHRINAEAIFRRTIKRNPDELSNVVTNFSDFQLIDLFIKYQKRATSVVLDILFEEMKNRELFDAEDNTVKATQHVLKAMTHDSMPTYLYDRFICRKLNPYDGDSLDAEGLLVKLSDIKGIEQTRATSQLSTKIDVIKIHYVEDGEKKEFNIEPDSMSKWLSTLNSMGLKQW